MQLTMTLGSAWLVTTLATLFVLTCIFMMLVILIQKPKGGGLSGAFGGAGGSAQAAFGAKTGDLLTTSSESGRAMRVTDYTAAQGAVLGKALGSIDPDTGLVLVLVGLQ